MLSTYFRVFKLGMHAGACAYNQDTSYRCTVSVRFWCIESNHARDSPDHVSVRELPFSLSLFSVPLYMRHTHIPPIFAHFLPLPEVLSSGSRIRITLQKPNFTTTLYLENCAEPETCSCQADGSTCDQL